ncbi:hypothetical protein P3T76_006897 [Phytophthora citrophthora]|uniref:Secreted protein n=1 Tax=Phytophthora citrophthora TaxID=4793 RepID=A0AAD9GP90_9STRA|nr:hypothetical protein P3T76_006897 [Phytophthora citrophthora]
MSRLSIIATDLPLLALSMAHFCPAGPLPITMRSKCSLARNSRNASVSGLFSAGASVLKAAARSKGRVGRREVMERRRSMIR